MSGIKGAAPKRGKGFSMPMKYGVRAICDGVIGDIGSPGENLAVQIRTAKNYAKAYGLKAWIFNVRTGEKVFVVDKRGGLKRVSGAK
jgi:hypothetical protein